MKELHNDVSKERNGVLGHRRLGDASSAPGQHDGDYEEEEDDHACSQDNQDECEATSTSQVVPPTKQNDVWFYQKQLRKVVFEGHRRAQHPKVMRHMEVEFRQHPHHL